MLSAGLSGEGVLVVLPTYNESQTIGALISQILMSAPDLTVLVVDDGSPDGTGGIVSKLAADNHQVRIIDRGQKLGLGTAYAAGFAEAINQGYVGAITMDADFSHSPQHLMAILDTAVKENASMIIGSRYVRGGSISGWGIGRSALSVSANSFARLILRLAPKDCTSGYRYYSTELLGDLAEQGVRSHGYSALIEMLWICCRRRGRVCEVPIAFQNRSLGESKISRSEIVRGIFTVLRLAARQYSGRAQFTNPVWQRN